MNVRTALLGLFVALTIVLASTTVYESGIRTTLTSTSTSTNTFTSTLIQTTALTSTTQSSVPYGFQFITGSGICTSSGALALCWGEPAYVFNCPPSLPFSESDATCDQVVTSDVFVYPAFGISVTSYHNQSEPWANCAYQFGFASEQGAYCVPLNSTAFILGEPAPPSSTSVVQSSSIASIQVSAPSVSRLNPQTGLNLTLSLSASANPYPTITIKANDFNTLDRANNLTTPEDWAVPVGHCPGNLFEYALYQGNYGLGNLTQGTQLTQSNGIGTCIGETTYCIFNPVSTEATVYWAPDPFNLKPSPTNASISTPGLLGFWGTNPAYPQGAYLVFPAGTYTVAAVDQWGNIVLSHFTVLD